METEPVLTFISHIEGKNAKVHVYRDRIEWERKRSGLAVASRAALALPTAGLSLIGGAGRGSNSSDMIPMSKINGVTTKRDGLVYTKVCVITPGDNIEFRVGHSDAAKIKQVISELMLALN